MSRSVFPHTSVSLRPIQREAEIATLGGAFDVSSPMDYYVLGKHYLIYMKSELFTQYSPCILGLPARLGMENGSIHY
jgi:hypothetical protein